MTIRIILALLICSACHSGLIPCPEARGPRLRTSYAKRGMLADRAVNAPVKQDIHARGYLVERTPELEHISVEEWDCPRPGAKNLPKSVKQNIRKNQKKVRDYYRNRADSLASYSAVPSRGSR